MEGGDGALCVKTWEGRREGGRLGVLGGTVSDLHDEEAAGP